MVVVAVVVAAAPVIATMLSLDAAVGVMVKVSLVKTTSNASCCAA